MVYALIDEADDLVLLGGSQSHVLSSEPEARRFFKYAILEDRLGHNLLELAVFSVLPPSTVATTPLSRSNQTA